MTLRPGTLVELPSGRRGYIRAIVGDTAQLHSEKYEFEDRTWYSVNILRPVNWHYSPATATEPAEIDGEYDDEIPY